MEHLGYCLFKTMPSRHPLSCFQAPVLDSDATLVVLEPCLAVSVVCPPIPYVFNDVHCVLAKVRDQTVSVAAPVAWVIRGA